MRHKPAVRVPGTVVVSREAIRIKGTGLLGLVPDELHPGRTPVHHPSDAGGIGWVEVTGDEAQIRRWLGPDFDALPVRIRAGDPELLAVGITTGGGQEIVLR